MPDKIIEGMRVVVIEDVIGYYVKSCGAQISISVPKRREGLVLRVKPIKVEIDFPNRCIWVPRDKIKEKVS
jgi:hypothetical protein